MARLVLVVNVRTHGRHDWHGNALRSIVRPVSKMYGQVRLSSLNNGHSHCSEAGWKWRYL